jgi:Helicase associated domain
MITTQDHIDFESCIVHYFEWRVANLATVESYHELPTPTKSINSRKASLRKSTNSHSKADAARREDVSSSLSAAMLLPKYKKIVNLLQAELHFVKILEHVVHPSNNDALEPEVFSSWKQSQSKREFVVKGTQDSEASIQFDIYKDDDSDMSPVSKKQRTDDFGDTPVRLTNALTRRSDVPADVKQIFQAVAKETTAAKRKVASLETKLLKKALTLETREEKLKKETETKVAKMKSKFKKKQEELQAQQKKMKEQKKREREEKKKKLEENKKKYEKWEHRYDQLIDFYKKYGHCKVTRHYKDYPSLSEWVSDQRKYYRRKSSKLCQDRVQKLNDLNFVWDPPSFQKTFQIRVEECKEFKQKHGHLRIPLFNEKNEDGSDPTEEQKRFRLWARSIRLQYKRRMVEKIHNNLDKSKIQALDEIGFDWDYGTDDKVELSAVAFNDRFLDRVEQLREVKRVCGTCNDKKSILKVFPNENSLYIWVKTQRKKYRNWKEGKAIESLSEERREMLRELGFDFEPRKHYAKRGSDVTPEPAEALPDTTHFDQNTEEETVFM